MFIRAPSTIERFCGKSSFKLRNGGKLVEDASSASSYPGERASGAETGGGVLVACRGGAWVLSNCVCGAAVIGVMKKPDKFVDEEFAETRGVVDVESPRTGEFGSVNLDVGELGLLFFNRWLT